MLVSVNLPEKFSVQASGLSEFCRKVDCHLPFLLNKLRIQLISLQFSNPTTQIQQPAQILFFSCFKRTNLELSVLMAPSKSPF